MAPDTTSNDDQNNNPTRQQEEHSLLKSLHQHVSQLLTPPPKHNNSNSNSHNKSNKPNAKDAERRLVWDTLEREYNMGRNVRWFSRVFTMALSLYRGDWIEYKCRLRKLQRQQEEEQHPSDGNNNNKRNSNSLKQPMFEAGHLLDALVAQGASIQDHQLPTGGKTSSNNNNNSIVLMTGSGSNKQPTAVDPRIQALLDLSPPQVALILSARRILARDAQWNEKDHGAGTQPPPLTLGRMLQEYGRFRATSHSSCFGRHLLWMAFQELLQVNLLRPAIDQCGTGPFQYEHNKSSPHHYNGSVTEAEDVPLHLLVDIHRELMEALKANVIECSTAMRNWGMKTNT